MANAPKFTDQDIELIIKSLPDGVDKQRLKLLPKILREWAKTDLPPHLLVPSAKLKKQRVSRLTAIGGSATKLLQTLDAVDHNGERFWLVRAMLMADGLRLSPHEQTKLENRFQETRAFLEKLSSASEKSAEIWKQGKGQPRNDAASLVLMDIIAIYEWLTDKKATRRADRDTFKDTGPLWNFSGAIWPLAFSNGKHGLSAAIRNWDLARKKRLKGINSPLLANIAMRHPKWRIFET